MPTVESSMIAAIAYDEAAGELYITFHESGTYTYFEVPKRVYDAFLKARSKGQFFNDRIKDEYPYARGAPRYDRRRSRRSRR